MRGAVQPVTLHYITCPHHLEFVSARMPSSVPRNHTRGDTSQRTPWSERAMPEGPQWAISKGGRGYAAQGVSPSPPHPWVLPGASWWQPYQQECFGKAAIISPREPPTGRHKPAYSLVRAGHPRRAANGLSPRRMGLRPTKERPHGPKKKTNEFCFLGLRGNFHVCMLC